MTAEDVRHKILAWSGIYPSLDELAASDRPPEEILAEVGLGMARSGMRRATERPGMFGVSTTVEMFGLFVRWRLWQLDRPDLVGPDQVDWQPPSTIGALADDDSVR